ncbi:unnamed protein product [Menidia menidia]|uniref:(Atlantic silverside) hypothetical protein n=1 Tax=Menidia menidia TaxID=238744 RepID=A0A8S4BWD8_9TELE|nr:unnamed protein product [Menidia menidia]
MELDIRQYLAKANENRDSDALQSAYCLIKTAAEAAGGRIPRISSELYLVCAEAGLQLGCVEISSACLKLYFDGNQPASEFYCRALLCQAQLKSPPATGSVEEFQEAVKCYLKAIEVAKNEPRCHFMVFNASVLFFQTVRPLLQPGRGLLLVPSLKEVLQSLEEVSDEDYSWRAELMMHLLSCLVDSGEVEEATSFSKVTEEFINSHCPHLYPSLYMLLVQHGLSEDEFLLQMSEQCSTLAAIYKMQEFKKWMEFNKNKPTGEDSTKLEEIFCLLVERAEAPAIPVKSPTQQSPTSIQPSDRVAFLLELALLALQVKHQKVAADCLKELQSAGEASADQRVMMECVNCELNLLKKKAHMKDYSKASVEARLKEIGKLDQCLQAAVREGGPQAVQAVCVTQWSLCLPLLQHNLRKHIKAPLLKLAKCLEDIQSVLLEVRCQVHSELAVIEEEEGCLEASLTHLQKAMLLDDGVQRERLSSAVHLLQLRRSPHPAPARAEDKAAMLMQQTRDMPPQDHTDSRAVLVSVGLLLAPDDFQVALDADDTSGSCLGSEPAVQLAAKAKHHSACVQMVGGHLARQGEDGDSTERAKLWATLAKLARKLEVWDVCRAACRFCLLYDDGRWKISETDKCMEDERSEELLCGHGQSQSCVQMLRLLAEIHFISAEATIQKLLVEGVQLNSPAVPPQEGMSEEDPHWITYREWIRALSAYSTSNFLRAGELGAEIGEPWVVANTAVYLWNYNNHLLSAGEYQLLLPTFQTLVEMLQRTKDSGNRALCVLMCDAVARGLIQPLSERESDEPAPGGDKGKNRAVRGAEKAASTHGAPLDPAALQDARKAIELCEYALRISSCHITGETVPIAVKKKVLATWVQIKRMLQQQIGSKLDMLNDEAENEEESAMMNVLVGVEMLRSNRNQGHMAFSVPSLSALVSMASECSWTDALVELQVWCQLAAFCHHVKDHSLVLQCTQIALQLGEAAAKSLNTTPCVLYSPDVVNELLSSAACLRGLSLVHKSSGDQDAYKEALKVLLSGVSFAEKAGNRILCSTAAGHYWNACLPLTQTLEGRSLLKEHLEKILNALVHTTKHEKEHCKSKKLTALRALPGWNSKQRATKDEEDPALRTAIYSLLLHIHSDKGDFDGALRLLDKAIKDIPCSMHRMPLLKYRILLKARRGESILLDMQKFQDESGQCCSLMWHQAAQCDDTLNHQLTYYQRAIESLGSTETRWQKVSLLLEFAEWLYRSSFPKADALQQAQWAIDMLLQVEPDQAEVKSQSNLTPVKLESLEEVNGVFIQNLSSLKEVRRLDYLIQAHVLLAVISDKTSHEHQLSLLRAYTFVLQIWQVSMAVACEISSEMAMSQPQPSPPSAESKKGKDKGKSKKVKDEPSPTEERNKPVVLDETPPSSPRDWARYTQSLFFLSLLEKELRSLSLDHLTLPVLHLAETIANDLLDRKGLSDLYRLRIVQACVQLGLESHSPYEENLLSLSGIQETEQMGSHKAIALSQKMRGLHKDYSQRVLGDKQSVSWRHGKDASAHDLWLDKAEVCLSMGLYQQARQLLAEAHMVAKELGDERAVSRSLLGLATLACEEQNYAQALILLDKAQSVGGDDEFWYQFTLTKVTAVVGLGDKDSQTKVDEIIKEGCDALQLVLGKQVNRGPELTFMITSLENRGAVEYVHTIVGVEPGETLSAKVFQRLRGACDTLRRCATVFTELCCRERAAKTLVEHACALRLLASHSTDRETQQQSLLEGLSQMQLAVTLQEHVALNVLSLLSPQQSLELSLAAVRKLLRLRLTLADFCLTVLERHCAAEMRQALVHAGKTPAEIALEEFTRSSPEPDSTEEEWMTAGRTLGQMAVSQLAAVSAHTSDDKEIRARCLTLMGKYLRLTAARKEPMYLNGIWDRHKQKGAWSDPKGFTAEESSSEKVEADPSRKELGMTSATNSKLQQSSHKAQLLLVEARKALSEAISLCLQNNMSSILADASLNMLECQGQSDPAVAGQCLALFQSCCAVSMAAEVLRSACPDTTRSQLSALLCIHRNLLLSQEERPSSMLKGVEESLIGICKAFSHLTISPNHLNILSELPPNLKILLLQHSEDGSELYGGFYGMTKAPDNQKVKTAQGTLTCLRVAKASVCPQALLSLREQTLAFDQETGLSLLMEDSWHGAESWSKVTARHSKSALLYRGIVRDMEGYLKPLLTQFDFSCIRPQAASEMTKSKDKEEKGSSVVPGENLVILADKKLLELPLESLSILQSEGLSSVSRDFSLQIFYSRIRKEEPPKAVESDSKKETKGGKGTKGKADQSQAIKVMPANPVLPSHTFPMDTQKFKYIVDPYNEGHFGETSLSAVMKTVLDTHSQHLCHLWEGFMGNKGTPSLSDVEQVLSRCSGFIYLGMDNFVANIPPSKLAALNLSECRMVMLFDRVQNKASVRRLSNFEGRKSGRDLTLEKPLETALLLSLGGVGCILLNQWHSSLQQNALHVATVLHGILKDRETCGHTVHALRREDSSEMQRPLVTASYDRGHLTNTEEGEGSYEKALPPSAFNCVLYGLPNLIVR